MAWTTLDWGGEIWDAATGLAAVAEIHTAIEQRADCIGHSVLYGEYEDGFSGDVWLSEPPSEPASRQYLKTVLEGFYDGILDLLDAPNAIFTTTLGGDTAWTIEDVIADMSMGEFSDTLLGPQFYSAFLWLRESLDRLIYARGFHGSITSPQEYAKLGTPETTAPDAWANAIARTEAATGTTDPTVYASMLYSSGFNQHSGAIGHRFDSGDINPIAFKGTQLNAKWEFRVDEVEDCTLTEIPLSIDGAAPVNVSLEAPTFITVDAEDLPLGEARTDITLAMSPIPPTMPFDGVSGSGTIGRFIVRLYAAWVYFDLSSELTDQS